MNWIASSSLWKAVYAEQINENYSGFGGDPDVIHSFTDFGRQHCNM